MIIKNAKDLERIIATIIKLNTAIIAGCETLKALARLLMKIGHFLMEAYKQFKAKFFEVFREDIEDFRRDFLTFRDMCKA